MERWVVLLVWQLASLGAFSYMDGATRGYPDVSALGLFIALGTLTLAFMADTVIALLVLVAVWVAATTVGLVFGRYAALVTPYVRLSV